MCSILAYGGGEEHNYRKLFELDHSGSASLNIVGRVRVFNYPDYRPIKWMDVAYIYRQARLPLHLALVSITKLRYYHYSSTMRRLPLPGFYTRPYICPACRKHLRRQRRNYAIAASQNPELFDVVCVGGGPAGLSMLTALRMPQPV